MSEMEQPSEKPDKKSGPKTEQSPSVPLTAEEGRLLAVEAIAKTRKNAEDLLGLNTDFAKAAIAKFDVPEDTIAQTVSSGPEQTGKLRVVRRRKGAGQEDDAATGRNTRTPARVAPPAVSGAVPPAAPAADPVSDPLRMDVKTQTDLKDKWLEQLVAQCNGDPKLAAVAGELQALVGTNPEDSVVQALEEKLNTLTAPASADPMPAPVPPIKRKVDSTPIPVPAAQRSPAPVPNAAVPPTTMPAQAATPKPRKASRSSSKKDKPDLSIPPEWKLVPKEEQADPEKWTLVPKEAGGIETPASPEAPKEEEPSEEDKLRELIDGLRTKVGEARLEYVTTEYKQNSAWMKVKRFFGKSIGEAPADEDTQSVLGRYKLALANLQEAELALLKKEGLSGEALRERMGQMLNYYKLEERITLFDTRNQVKMESMNAGHILVTMVESIGREYNKLPRKAKYTLGAICLATGLLTGGGVIGGGAAAAASGLVLIKKLIATTGLAITVDTGIEQWMEKRRSASAGEEKKAEMSELDKIMAEGNQEVSLERLTELVNKDINQLAAKFKTQKKEALIRRSAVWGVAAAGAVGMGASWVSHALDNGGSEAAAAAAHARDSLAAARALGVEVPADASAVTTEGGVKLDNAEETVKQYLASHPSGGASAELLPGAASVGVSESAALEVSDIDDHTQTILSGEGEAPSPLDIKEANAARILEDHTVTPADGKKGLWGILQGRLPDNIKQLPVPEQNRILSSIENLMNEDFQAMSSKEQLAAGFHGSLDKIWPGETIHMDHFKSLTPERIQAIIDGQSVGAPSGAGVADVIDRPTGPPNGISPIDQNAIDEGGDVAVPDPVSSIERAEILNDFRGGPGVIDPYAVARPGTPTVPAPSSVPSPYEDAPSSAVKASVEATPTTPSIPVPEALNLSTLTPEQLLAARPGLAVFYAESQLRFNDVLFDTPENLGKIPVIVRIPGTIPEGAEISNMAQMLRISQDFRTGQIDPAYWDRHNSPLPSYQVDRLAHLARVSAHPNVLGELGLVRDGETAAQYVRRIVATAVATGKVGVLAQHYRGNY